MTLGLAWASPWWLGRGPGWRPAPRVMGSGSASAMAVGGGVDATGLGVGDGVAAGAVGRCEPLGPGVAAAAWTMTVARSRGLPPAK